MTNEEKAKEICERDCNHFNDDYCCNNECEIYKRIVEIAEWKDKQLKDYINGAIEAVKDCQPLVKMLNEMIKDLGL